MAVPPCLPLVLPPLFLVVLLVAAAVAAAAVGLVLLSSPLQFLVFPAAA